MVELCYEMYELIIENALAEREVSIGMYTYMYCIVRQKLTDIGVKSR